MSRNTFTTKDCCSTSFGKKKDSCELQTTKKSSKWKFWKKNK